MKNIKKTLTIFGWVCLGFALLDCGTLAYVITQGYTTFNIVSQSLCIALSLATGIAYLVFASKSQDYILNHKNAFFWITLLNILNGIIVWILAFWVEISVNQVANARHLTTMVQNYSTQTMLQATPEERENMQIQMNTQKLAVMLKELTRKKEKGEITEEQYRLSRQQIIDKI